MRRANGTCWVFLCARTATFFCRRPLHGAFRLHCCIETDIDQTGGIWATRSRWIHKTMAQVASRPLHQLKHVKAQRHNCSLLVMEKKALIVHPHMRIRNLLYQKRIIFQPHPCTYSILYGSVFIHKVLVLIPRNPKTSLLLCREQTAWCKWPKHVVQRHKLLKHVQTFSQATIRSRVSKILDSVLPCTKKTVLQGKEFLLQVLRPRAYFSHRDRSVVPAQRFLVFANFPKLSTN